MFKHLFSLPKSFFLLIAITGLVLSACEDENPQPSDEAVLPITYNFENVDYSGQTARLKMVDSLISKAKSANDGSTVVTFDELNAIFTNESGNLFGSSKQIKDKTAAEAVAEIEGYFQQINDLSGHSENIVGEKYLVNEQGLEPTQLLAKGLMGALMYYQATSVYLSNDKMNVDNTEVSSGEGTAMQHHWDEAFGYFGAPEDYLTNNEAISEFWASYATQRSNVMEAKEKIFNAFIEGRAAIGRNDMEARDAAIETIKKNWELLIAANVVHYLNAASENLEAGDESRFYHHFSEGKAFLNSFKYNLDKSITATQIEEINSIIGNNAKEAFSNKSDTKAAFEQASLKLQEIFEFTNVEMLNL